MSRKLIRERVRSGLASAKAKGKRLGRRPKVFVDHARIASLRAQERSWAEICKQLKQADGYDGSCPP